MLVDGGCEVVAITFTDFLTEVNLYRLWEARGDLFCGVAPRNVTMHETTAKEKWPLCLGKRVAVCNGGYRYWHRR